MACSPAGSSVVANPLDSSVNSIPARVAWRLAHSLPLIHYAFCRVMPASWYCSLRSRVGGGIIRVRRGTRAARRAAGSVLALCRAVLCGPGLVL